MNHTTLGIVAVLAAVVVVVGVFAVITQAAYADSVSLKQINKQKAKCLALVISRANACNQHAENIFRVQ
jgi:Tfp pilus assembly protein PilE